MKYQHLIIVICIYCCSFQAPGQVHENAVPLSATVELPDISDFLELNPDENIKSDPSSKTSGLWQFARPVYTNLDPTNSGQWTQTPHGKIWRLGIHSNNAHSLYLNMCFSLTPGARIFVYGPGYQDLHGAFTSRNNNSSGVLTIAPVRGNKLILELDLPPSQQSYGVLNINKVYHDYANIFESSFPQGRQPLNVGDCEEDINCANGKYWQTEKRSVCKIISNGGMGTGTFVGNTSGNSAPYVLTAYHLISTAETAAEVMFIFNHETMSCQGSLSTTVSSLSGAAILATTDHQADFTLLKPHETPPASYRPFYAGWDAGNTVPQRGVCIHHPFGGAKQIAIEYHPLADEDIGIGFDENSTWKVPHWELGTTEPGSSGAPLFDGKHRVVGTLSGGRSTCGYARDDYFTKFGVSWDSYPNPSNQLKNWLDSAQTGQLVLDGYDPYGFNEALCYTAWNFTTYDQPELSSKNLSWGWLSGHNSAGYTQFAEHYETAGVLQVNGVYLNVAKAHAATPLANIELKVWEGDNHPDAERYSALLFIKDLVPDQVNYVAFDSALKISGHFFVGYKINYTTAQDTFALYHTSDRGHTKPSSMYVYKDGWHQTKDRETFGFSTSLGIGISECYGKSRKTTNDLLNMYPNPCSSEITLDIPAGLPIRDIKCFDSSGRPMAVVLNQMEDDTRLHFSLKPGLYYLKIFTSGKSFTGRFIVSED